MSTGIDDRVSWFDDRFYKVETEDGCIAYYPSVTTVLQASSKPYLARWRGDVGNHEADRITHEAMDRGSRIHHACYVYQSGGLVLFDNVKHGTRFTDEEMKAYRDTYGENLFILREQDEMWQAWKFVECMKKLNPEIVALEKIVVSHDQKIAGQLDCLLTIEEGEYEVAGAKPLYLPAGLYVADIKTGKQIDDDSYMQLSAYRIMAEKEHGDIKGGLIIHTNAKTKKGIEGLNVSVRTGVELDSDWQDFLAVYQVWKRKNPISKPRVFDLPVVLSKTEEQ